MTNLTQNVSLGGSSYVFSNSGNYTIVVSATDYAGTSWGSYTQAVVPFEILSTDVMNNQTNISSITSYDNNGLTSDTHGTSHMNLTDSISYMIVEYNSTLVVTKGFTISNGGRGLFGGSLSEPIYIAEYA